MKVKNVDWNKFKDYLSGDLEFAQDKADEYFGSGESINEDYAKRPVELQDILNLKTATFNQILAVLIPRSLELSSVHKEETSEATP